MSRIGLSGQQLANAERRRDAVMIDLSLEDEERLDDAEVNQLNRLRGKLALQHPIAPSQRAWVEAIVARLGKSQDIGLVEDYAERTYAPAATRMDEQWRMGPMITKPPRRLT